MANHGIKLRKLLFYRDNRVTVSKLNNLVSNVFSSSDVNSNAIKIEVSIILGLILRII